MCVWRAYFCTSCSHFEWVLVEPQPTPCKLRPGSISHDWTRAGVYATSTSKSFTRKFAIPKQDLLNESYMDIPGFISHMHNVVFQKLAEGGAYCDMICVMFDIDRAEYKYGLCYACEVEIVARPRPLRPLARSSSGPVVRP